jgi:ubiquinone/menaquinone biosynthesis C-methylase UbiE
VSRNPRIRDVERFDRWAPGYDRSWTQRIFFAPIHQGVVDVVSRLGATPRRLLDVGCGTGALLRVAAQQFPEAELVGVDASPEMIRMATLTNPSPGRLRFVQGQAECLPFAGGHFDLILSTISFHHWADQQAGLQEVARVLAPGGSFLLADHFVIPVQRVFFATPGRRKRFHTPAEIDGMLGEAGLVDPTWHDIYKIGPLLLITGVTASTAPIDNALLESYSWVVPTGEGG